MTVIKTETESTESTVSVTTSKLSPVAGQVQDLHLSAFQCELGECFKGVLVEQHMRETFASCCGHDNYDKGVRGAVVSFHHCAAPMPVVIGGKHEEEEEAGGDNKKRALARNDSRVSVGGGGGRAAGLTADRAESES